jgi:hypothetical protein
MRVPAPPLSENGGLAFPGDRPGGRFEISTAEAQRLLADSNPHGKPNSDVVRPWCPAPDLLRRPGTRWIIDFPPGMDEREAALYRGPYALVRRRVRPVATGRRRAWWEHSGPQAAMRVALAKRDRFLATSVRSQHRLFIWLPPEVLPGTGLTVFARDDDWFFGVLQSRVHAIWHLLQLSTPSAFQSFSPSAFQSFSPSAFQSFPFPWPPGTPLGKLSRVQDERRTAIAQAACRLTAQQAGAGIPLAELYRKPPGWLATSHAELDAAVAAAYGWSDDPSESAIADRLAALHQERLAL